MTHAGGTPANGRVWLTRREAADYARVSLSTIDRAIRAKALRVQHPTPHTTRIRRTWVERWMQSGGVLLLILILVLALAVLPMHGCAGKHALTHHHRHHVHYHEALPAGQKRAASRATMRGKRLRR